MRVGAPSVRSNVVRRVALGLMVLGLGGCATSYPHLSFAVEQRLLRETTLDDMDVGKAGPGDALVRVTRTGREGGSCSGAIIGPRHVLTAEHCMMKMTQQMERTDAEIVPGDVHVELGGDYLPWGEAPVRAIVAPDCGYVSGDGDIAILVLSRHLIGVPTVPIRLEQQPRKDEELRVYGFGRCALSRDAIHRVPRTSSPL